MHINFNISNHILNFKIMLKLRGNFGGSVQNYIVNYK